MYPFKFTPIYKEILWGGRDLEKMGRNLPPGKKIAESWELSVREKDNSVISNGYLKGKTLSEVLEKSGKQILGDVFTAGGAAAFPLLVKIIDANDRLSVQVHPSDGYAEKSGGEAFGKDETWVILDCDKDAEIVYGFRKGMDREKFIRAIDKGEVEKCLNYIKVRPGDVYNIYPGLVHGIGKGIVTAEIQQNSNTTYRIFDYNREDDKGNRRELHIEKALDVIEFENRIPFGRAAGVTGENYSGNILKTYVNNEHYTLQTLQVANEYMHDTKGICFYIYLCTSGRGVIEYAGGTEQVSVLETILIPAALGEYKIKGELSLIRAFAGPKHGLNDKKRSFA